MSADRKEARRAKSSLPRIFGLIALGGLLIAGEFRYFDSEGRRAEEKLSIITIASPTTLLRGEIGKGLLFAASLIQAGLGEEVTREVTAALLRGGEFNFRRCRPGDRFAARLDGEGRLRRFTFQTNPLTRHIVEARDGGGGLESRVERLKTTTTKTVLSGTIKESFYASIIERGEMQRLAGNVVRFFEYDIDFAQECRKNDTYRIFLERVTSKGRVVDYGRIFAAEYRGAVTGTVRGYWFPHEDKAIEGYYNEKGVKQKKFLLRSPLDALRVTSRFGMRFHPVLKKKKMHMGIDYGAPSGTRVWAVAQGTVTWAGSRGGYGKMVEIRHMGGLVSRYAHLSRIHVRRGQKVQQRRIIGRVGKTGRATAPHLHFELIKNGRQINPAKVKIGATIKLSKKLMPALEERIQSVNAEWAKAEVIEDGTNTEGVFR